MTAARVRLFVGGLPVALAAALFACSDAGTAAAPLDAGAEDAAGDAGRTRDTGTDAGVADGTLCGMTRAYFEGCGFESELACGADFDTWCSKNDSAVNSEAYRNAERACLTAENCEPDERRSCEFAHYASETLTASQAALVDAYCATCEPGDASCKARATEYDAKAGPDGVPDVFVAAWELGDPLVDEIRTACTGDDAGTSAAECAKAFGSCAAGFYLDRVPDCPKDR